MSTASTSLARAAGMHVRDVWTRRRPLVRATRHVSIAPGRTGRCRAGRPRRIVQPSVSRATCTTSATPRSSDRARRHVHDLLRDRSVLAPRAAPAELVPAPVPPGGPLPRHPGAARRDRARVDPAAARQALDRLPEALPWPPFSSIANALERLAIFPLVAGSLFLLFTGLANINLWYPWKFNFPIAHYWVAWITIGALIVHIGAKWSITRRRAPPATHEHGRHRRYRRRGRQRRPSCRPSSAAASSRRVFGTSAVVTLFTVGQTVRPLRKLALLAPAAGHRNAGLPGEPHRADRRRRPTRRAHPTTGWSSTARSASAHPHPRRPPRTPPTHRDAADRVRRRVEHARSAGPAFRFATCSQWPARDRNATRPRASLQQARSYRTSDLNHWQAHDPDTLLALHVNGEELALDHGYPLRLIGPTDPASCRPSGSRSWSCDERRTNANPVAVLVLRSSSAEPSALRTPRTYRRAERDHDHGSSSNGSSAPTSPTTSSSRRPPALSAPSSLDSFRRPPARRSAPGSSPPRSCSRSRGHRCTATATRSRPETRASNRSTTRPRSPPSSSPYGRSPAVGSRSRSYDAVKFR